MTVSTLTGWERRGANASLIFDLVDRFARDRGIVGARPPIQGRVRFRIVATEENNVRTTLSEPLEMVMDRNVGGYDLWFGIVARKGSNPIRHPVPPPTIVVEVDGDHYQRVEKAVASLPQGGAPLEFLLEPGYAYEFPRATSVPGATGPTLLRGTLRRSNGSGIAGSTVWVNPPPAGQVANNPAYVTDTTGNWALPFTDAVASTSNAQVRITNPDEPTIDVTEVTITRGDTEALRQASVAGSSRLGSGRPMPGVILTIDLVPGASTVSDSRGEWELWLPIGQLPPSGGATAAVITATPPQGAPMVRNVQVQPRVTTHVEPFVFP